MRGAFGAFLMLGLACGPSESPTQARSGDAFGPAPLGIPAPLDEAICEVQVDGVGLIEMETDYLPHVIKCENGGANLEALKAQAIAARSVAYWTLLDSGSICDGQGCQVYSCGNEPNALAYQAVEETAGQYVLYNGNLTYAFYVAGVPNVSGPSCIGAVGGSATEQWVTYNEGLTSTDVEQTALGFIHDPGDAGYGQNRGCMSQWGARCLENELGYEAEDILRFFYGEDIILATAQGECVPDTGGTTGTETSTGTGTSAGTESSTSEESGEAGTSEDTFGGEESGSTQGEGTSTAGEVGTSPGLDESGPGGSDDASSGCACASDDAQPRAAIWAFVLLGTWRRRRRQTEVSRAT